MAHLVEKMAYIGDTPWHGLGNQLTASQPLEVWLEQAGLDWELIETPVRYLAGGKRDVGEVKAFPQNKVLYRSDTLVPLSVVSDRYQVVQPRQVLEFYRDLTEKSGFELETAGVLKGGRKIWALARTGQTGVLKGKDETNGYVLLATACDGTLATTAQFTSVRVVCNNTLAVALEGKAQSVKVSHRSVFDPEAVKKQLGISVSSWDDFMYWLKTLSERKVQGREVDNLLQRIFTSPTPNGPRTNEKGMKAVHALYQGAGRGADLASAKGTAYGLLNAVTEFVDHGKRARSTDHRLDSAWFGQGAALKQRALDEALDLVS